MITYPDKPWVDGQQFTQTTTLGDQIIGTYSAERNSWTFQRVSTAAITTTDVLTSRDRPEFPSTYSELVAPEDIENLTTQELVNWAIADEIVALKNQIARLTNPTN